MIDDGADRCRNSTVRKHLAASHSLFPHGIVRRSTIMTPRGPTVLEQELADSMLSDDDDAGSTATRKHGQPPSSSNAAARSAPIADLLLSRWLHGLKAAVIG